jgi:hypothetical protein
MPFDLGKMIRRDSNRRGGKETMVIPVHETVDNQYQWHTVQPVLGKCADQIVASGLVWKWCRFTGRHVLVRLSEERTFVGFDIQDWCAFLGQHWQIVDNNGFEWLGPSHAVGDRIMQAVLRHPKLPIASWSMQLEQRKGRK